MENNNITTAFELPNKKIIKNLGLVKTGKPTPAKPQRHSESAEEKAAFLQFKKDLLSKTKTSIAEYDDIPE